MSSSTYFFLLFALISSTSALLGIGRTQSVAVSGRLICNGQPASGVKLKLYEKESSKLHLYNVWEIINNCFSIRCSSRRSHFWFQRTIPSLWIQNWNLHHWPQIEHLSQMQLQWSLLQKDRNHDSRQLRFIRKDSRKDIRYRNIELGQPILWTNDGLS